MRNFKDYIENRESPDSSSEAKEALREIQIVMNEAIGRTQRINGFGLNDIKFLVINQEQAEGGMQINLEAKGSAIAKNKEHVSHMLQKLLTDTREELWKKRIYMEMMYHKLEASEVATEADETPIGLKKTLYYTVICAAIIFI